MEDWDNSFITTVPPTPMDPIPPKTVILLSTYHHSPGHLWISYKSRFASSWLSCSASRKSARFSVFLGTVPLPPCFIWNVDFPQDCMSPDLFLDTCPHSPTSYCEARKHGRLFLLFPLTSSHCSLSWCPLSSFWHAAILPCAHLSSCILLLNIH